MSGPSARQWVGGYSLFEYRALDLLEEIANRFRPVEIRQPASIDFRPFGDGPRPREGSSKDRRAGKSRRARGN